MRSDRMLVCPSFLRFGRRPSYPSTATLGDLELRRRLILDGVSPAAYAVGTIGEPVIGGQFSVTCGDRACSKKSTRPKDIISSAASAGLVGKCLRVCGFAKASVVVVEPR